MMLSPAVSHLMRYRKPPIILGGGGSTYLLDAITQQPTAAYSTRKLKSAYSGYALRVSNNAQSATQDIGFIGDELDISAVASFAAANSTAAYVQKWYDQSGNGNDLSGGDFYLTKAGVLETLNGNPAIYIDQPDSRSLITRSSAISTVISASAFTILSSMKPLSFQQVVGNQLEGAPALFSDSGGYIGINGFVQDSTLSNIMRTWIYDGADKGVGIAASSQSYAVVSKFGGGTIGACLNGGALTTTSAGNIQSLTGTIKVGTNWSSAQLDALITDLLIYNVALTSADINTLGGGSSIIKGSLSSRCGSSWTAVP